MSRFNYGRPFDKDESDVSEADPNDIAKILKDTDDIDGDLFKGMSSKQSLSKTMPAAMNKPPVHPPKSKNFDDDILGGDLDALLERKRTNISYNKQQSLSSTMPAKKSAGVMFDDGEDLFGSSMSKKDTSKTKSLADELFGKSDNQNMSSSAEFKLNEKYTKMSQESSFAAQKSEENDTGFSGGYVPSTLRSNSTPQRGRNVNFTDELFSPDLLTRPKTSPAPPSNSNNNMMKTMPAPVTKSSEDWLGLSASSNKKEGSIFDEIMMHKPRQPGRQQSDMGSEILGSEYSTNRRAGSQLPPPPAVVTAPILPVASSTLKPSDPPRFQSTKDSMNSSFADSVDVGDSKPPIHPAIPIMTQTSVKPNKENEFGGSMAPSEAEDGWLNTLLTPKKPNPAGSNVANKKATNVQGGGISYDSNEVQAMVQKIKQLEYENQDLHMQLQHNKAHYELQIQLIQDGYEERIRVMKEDRENATRQFKEEKDSLKSHLEQVEKEKQELALSYKRKLDENQREYEAEMDRMKQIQRDAVEKLRDEHEEVVKRIKKFKETEVSAAMSATSHTRTIEGVIGLIEDNAKNLDSLSQRVQLGHTMNLSDVEAQIKNKQDQLRLHEEKLMRQQKEYESEIRQLNATILRLENHLAEQSKQVAEERWKGKQQEKKLEALQEALLNEQKIIMDKLGRERNDIERTKDDILIEQKRLMQQVYEEKRKIAEEKAYVEATRAAYEDKKHKDSLSAINLEAELSVNSKRLTEDKQRIERLTKELDERDAQLKAEKVKLDERRQELEIKAVKLEQMAFAVNQKYEKAEELFSKSNKEKEVQSKLLEQTNTVRQSHESRLNQIQQQLMLLSEKESQINQEKISVLKQRQDLELLKSKIVCTKCKDPVKDFSNGGPTNGFYASNQVGGLTLPSSGYATALFSTLNSTLLSKQQQPLLMNGHSDLDDAKQIRQMKIQAMKDRQFLNEERQFIDGLKTGTSFTLRSSYSMNHLDSALA